MKKPTPEKINQAMTRVFEMCPLDELYVSLHHVLLNEYGRNIEDQNGGNVLANELFNIRLLLEGLGEMKGIAFNSEL